MNQSNFKEIEVGLKENSGDKRNVYTYNLAGEKLYPLDPKYSKAGISLADIAISLASNYKFNGLSSRPYSMAEHSTLVTHILRQSLSDADRRSTYGIFQSLYALFMSADVGVFGMRSILHFNTPSELAQERMEWVSMIWEKFVVDANPHIVHIPKVEFDLIQSAKNIVLIAERQALLSIRDDKDRIDVATIEVRPLINMALNIITNYQVAVTPIEQAESFRHCYHLISSSF